MSKEPVETQNWDFAMVADEGDGDISVFTHEAMMAQVPGEIVKLFLIHIRGS